MFVSSHSFLDPSIHALLIEGDKKDNCSVFEFIQKALDIIIAKLPGKEVKIIGGAARAILDHLYFNKKLILRDLDIAIVMHYCVTSQETQALGESFKSDIPGIQTLTSLEDRPRIAKEIPLKARSYFSAGQGFFLSTEIKEYPLLDITLYHHEKDLHLNGLFEQDRISIVLSQECSFSQFMNKAAQNSIENLIDKGWVQQPPGAYQDWIQGKMQLANWEEIKLRPHLSALRIVRSLNKRGLLQEVVSPTYLRSNLQKQWKDLNQAIVSSSYLEYSFMSRLFERCLSDKDAALELKALSLVGVFDKWLPFLNDVIAWLSVYEIEDYLNRTSQHSDEEKLANLIADQPLEQQLHTLFFASGGVDKIVDAANKVWKRLKESFPDFDKMDLSFCNHLIHDRCKTDKEKFCRDFYHILSSRSLHEDEKLHLLLRSLLSNFQELQTLFPSADSEKLKLFWQKATKPRIGFFTGVFDPFINIHLKIIAYAIGEMVLDKVIVSPVYLSKKINRPCQTWADRHHMVFKGVATIPQVNAIEEELAPKLAINIETAFSALKTKAGAIWIHIAGTDAFERFKHLGLMERYLKENIRIFVIQRIGVRASLVPAKYVKLVSHFNPITPLGTSNNFSAQDVRTLIKGGQDITHLVPEKVAEYIHQKGLYAAEHPAMQMPWQVSSPEFLVSIIQQQLPFANIRMDLMTSSREQPSSSFQKGWPSLLCQIKDNPTDKQITLIYQQTLASPPITMETSCLSNNIEETAFHLLQTLIHHLIEH